MNWCGKRLKTESVVNYHFKNVENNAHWKNATFKKQNQYEPKKKNLLMEI